MEGISNGSQVKLKGHQNIQNNNLGLQKRLQSDNQNQFINFQIPVLSPSNYQMNPAVPCRVYCCHYNKLRPARPNPETPQSLLRIKPPSRRLDKPQRHAVELAVHPVLELLKQKNINYFKQIACVKDVRGPMKNRLDIGSLRCQSSYQQVFNKVPVASYVSRPVQLPKEIRLNQSLLVASEYGQSYKLRAPLPELPSLSRPKNQKPPFVGHSSYQLQYNKPGQLQPEQPFYKPDSPETLVKVKREQPLRSIYQKEYRAHSLEPHQRQSRSRKSPYSQAKTKMRNKNLSEYEFVAPPESVLKPDNILGYKGTMPLSSQYRKQFQRKTVSRVQFLPDRFYEVLRKP